MKRLLREPLLHFAVLGAALFALYGAVSGSDSGADRDIVVTRGQVESLSAGFERSWNRPPTEAELAGLVEGWVRDEVLYREGLALGLERDDVVVRKRVGQKFELLAEDAVQSLPPSDAELQAWLDAHAADYTQPPRASFEQVYFDPRKRRESLQRDVERALASRDPGALGDPTLLPAKLDDAPLRDVASQFGASFARDVAALPLGQWRGPIGSSYGAHVVRVTSRSEPGPPRLAAVREAVARDWEAARTRAAKDALYQRLRAGYQVTVESPAAGAE
jgi:hypothetical protein